MALHEAKQAFFTSLQPTNKQFWGTLKQINNTETTIPTLTSPNNVLVATTNAEKADCLNKHFSTCFNTALPQLSQIEILYLDPDKCPSHLLCSESEVYDQLVGVDVTKSTGPDTITGRMIKSTACSITPAVTALFNQTIRQGKIPKEWKAARITPAPKASDHTRVENYRPISILPILSKILE